jgi:ABC-type uncharacterized transport system auxiliary subunit
VRGEQAMSALCKGSSRQAKARLLRGRHVESAVFVGALVLIAACLQGCGTVPKTHYYTLDQIGAPTSGATPPAGSVLRVERLAVAEPYADRRMVFRPAGREVGFWDFHMWAQPLDRMITARVAERLSETGMFRKVDSFPYTWEKADLVLKGAVLAFEEVDRDDGWYGRAKIFLELVDPATGDVIWANKMDIEKKAGLKKAAAVVEALSQALDESVDRAASGMKTALDQRQK